MMNSWRTLLNQLTSPIRRQGSSSGSGGRRELIILNNRSFAGDASLPKQARVVICGGGIVGNSVAYHLADKGWTDVVVIEQENDIGKGTSVFGSGVLALLKPVDEQRIINKSIAIYKKLQQEGHNISLQECGSLYLAQNRERMVLFRRRVALNKPQGVECKVRIHFNHYLDPGKSSFPQIILTCLIGFFADLRTSRNTGVPSTLKYI